MADSIPSLRRLVNELRAKIRELESRPADVVVNEVVRVVETPGPVKVIETRVEIPGPERLVYQDNPDHINTIRKLQERLCQYTSQSDL